MSWSLCRVGTSGLFFWPVLVFRKCFCFHYFLLGCNSSNSLVGNTVPRQRMQKWAKVLSLAKRYLGFWERENSCPSGWFCGGFVCRVQPFPSIWHFSAAAVFSKSCQLCVSLAFCWEGCWNEVVCAHNSTVSRLAEERQEGGMLLFYQIDNG